MSRLEAFLKSDRQWLRANRISHALMQLHGCQGNIQEENFWVAVLKANGHFDDWS